MKRILIVDDDDAIRESLALALEDTYHVLLARDGMEALAVLDRERVDAVLLDVMMPVLDGMGVLAALGARPCVPPPIIVTSAGVDAGARGAGAGRAGVFAQALRPREPGGAAGGAHRRLDPPGRRHLASESSSHCAGSSGSSSASLSAAYPSLRQAVAQHRHGPAEAAPRLHQEAEQAQLRRRLLGDLPGARACRWPR